MKKIGVLFIFLILMVGFIAIAMADVEDKVSEDGNLEDIDEDVDAESVALLNNETDNILNNTLNKNNEKRVKIKIDTRVTHFSGFAISGDNGEPINGLWISHKFMRKNGVVKKSTGRLSLGHGDGKNKFKLLLKEFTNNSASFYVFPIDSNLEKVDRDNMTNTNIGTLNLDHKKYTRIVVWTGKLVLNSGIQTGTWDVTGWSRTKKIDVKKIEDARLKQIDKLKKRINESEANLMNIKEKTRERINKLKEKEFEKGEKSIKKTEERIQNIRKKWWQVWRSK